MENRQKLGWEEAVCWWWYWKKRNVLFHVGIKPLSAYCSFISWRSNESRSDRNFSSSPPLAFVEINSMFRSVGIMERLRKMSRTEKFLFRESLEIWFMLCLPRILAEILLRSAFPRVNKVSRYFL
ncbi:hypothetical protein CEXT_264351 [Caerostris extrusa]|uniref:Maturase K n=1 Tax=Caerostris extrusa TaxID=172846 RepID=A0AAV4P637_CAEEX|nr:hypothetical protein CEXT_264351 [Caerostris extrusa]